MAKPEVERQKSILNVLQGLQGIEPLKKLFWTELNYNRSNSSLSRKGWGELATSALAEDPVLFATGGNDFQVIYARLNSDKLLMGMERPVVSRLLQNHPFALYVFSNTKQDRWHFLNVKYEEDKERQRVFRRITIGPGERLRTASERIALLDIETISPSPSDRSALGIQKRHDDAFDVEAVQKRFFQVFADIYHTVAEDIARTPGLEDEAGRLAQLLLDRLLFLYFIQKKGWLSLSPDYLYSRFLESWKKDPTGSSYYAEVLYPLFLSLSNPDDHSQGLGAVPFLNGGLFEEAEKQTQSERLSHARLTVQNKTFKEMFDKLFERFNFTVTEDTPLDVEVAIDPEMLGKIFESLILQMEKDPDTDLRRVTGSYYTPRHIVHFISQEALKQYLISQFINAEQQDFCSAAGKIDKFLSLPPADHLDDGQMGNLKQLFTEAEARMLRGAILDCRICDPAVGSGAFPVAMLHEMVSAIAKLDVRIKGPQSLAARNYYYDLKKQIIESCLYGVDIQEQAVRLCELRLWLSLVVDYELDPTKPFASAIREVPSLPNLSYRIVRGDSLLERLFGQVVRIDEVAGDAKSKQLIDSIQSYKQAYFREGTTTEKRLLELRIVSKQAELAERLIDAQRAAVKAYQTSLLGDEALTDSQQTARSVYETEVQGLVELKTKVSAAKHELERLTKKGNTLKAGDIDNLRRQYFHTGTHPTFMWHIDFAEVFLEKHGFDVMIGNPPYLFGGNIGISREDKEAFKKQYISGAGKTNLFTLFIERSLNLLGPNRPLLFIVPNTLLRVTSYGQTREFLLKQHTVNMIVDLGAGMFDDVTMSTIVLSMLTGEPSNSHEISVRLGFNAPIVKNRQSDLLRPGFVIPTASPEQLKVLRKLDKNTVALGSLCDELIFGVVISGNKSDLVSTKPRRGLKPFLEGRDIDRYLIRSHPKYLDYKPAEIHRPRTPAIFEVKEKLLIQRITGGERPLAVAYDDKQFYTKESINNLILSKNCPYDIKFILALLNSSLFSWYYRIAFTNGSTLTVNLSKEYLSQLPIPVLDLSNSTSREQHDQLTELADEMLRATADRPASTARLDEKIDAAVYRLYGLAEADIRIVKGKD